MKKYYLIIILLLFTQCDYKPIYSKNNQNFGIRIIEFNENRSNKILATRLENYSYKKNNLFLYELKLLTSAFEICFKILEKKKEIRFQLY